MSLSLQCAHIGECYLINVRCCLTASSENASNATSNTSTPKTTSTLSDLKWVFQFPWRVKLCYNVPGNEKLVPIEVDTYVDMTQHDMSRPGVITVKARVVQEHNIPTRLWIPPNATLRAHLVRTQHTVLLRRTLVSHFCLQCCVFQAVGNYLIFCDGQLEDDIEFDFTSSGTGVQRGLSRSMVRSPLFLPCRC